VVELKMKVVGKKKMKAQEQEQEQEQELAQAQVQVQMQVQVLGCFVLECCSCGRREEHPIALPRCSLWLFPLNKFGQDPLQ